MSVRTDDRARVGRVASRSSAKHTDAAIRILFTRRRSHFSRRRSRMSSHSRLVSNLIRVRRGAAVPRGFVEADDRIPGHLPMIGPAADGLLGQGAGMASVDRIESPGTWRAPGVEEDTRPSRLQAVGCIRRAVHWDRSRPT
jgi:hypothetical protein